MAASARRHTQQEEIERGRAIARALGVQVSADRGTGWSFAGPLPVGLPAPSNHDGNRTIRMGVRPTPVLIALALLSSCRSTAVETADRLPDAAAAAGPLDEATVRSMTHAFLEAVDLADAVRFEATTGPAFVFFDDRDIRERAKLLEGIRARKQRGAPTRSRKYGTEQVWVGLDSAVYRGEAEEHYPVDGTNPNGDFDGRSTLVWAREAGVWKVVSWQWVKGGLDAERAEWNQTFREGKWVRPHPSQFLVDMVKGRKPGLALDEGMGQGRNAVYLATQGWTVTGVDISDEGIGIANRNAAAQHVHIDAINMDGVKYDPGVDHWDLITLIYVGCDADDVAKVRRGLKPGGLVVVEGYHKDSVPHIGFETGQLSALFKDGFHVLRDEVVQDVSDWGSETDGKMKLVRFAAEKQ